LFRWFKGYAHTHTLSLIYIDTLNGATDRKKKPLAKGKFYNQTQIEAVKWRIVLQNT